MRRLSRWLLRELFDGLTHVSRLWIHMPEPGGVLHELDDLSVLNGPVAGHPERMWWEVPPTRAEMELLGEAEL